MLLLAHVLACIWHYIGDYYLRQGEKNWISYFDLENAGTLDRYVESIYYIFITMSTIGYGDSFPVSTNEKIFVIFMSLVACGVFGYVITTISSILAEVSKRSEEF